MNPDVIAELERSISGEVRFDPYSRLLYSTDASNYQIQPIGVVIPRTPDDLAAVVEIAARRKLPLLARGGGSSLAGQAVGAAVVVDCSKYLNRIVEINAEERWVRVQPGVVCDPLDAALRASGLMFGPDPASANRATVGGIIGNNATGAHSVLYGMTADHVLSAGVVLADGSRATFGPVNSPARRMEAQGLEGDIYRETARLVAQHEAAIRARYPRTWRRASGYSLNYLVPPHGFAASRPPGWNGVNTAPSRQSPVVGRQSDVRPLTSEFPYPASSFNLAKLLCGSEGTLAVIAEATLNLVPRPKMTALCIAHFDSVVAAAEAAPAVLETEPSAVELLDRMLIDLAREAPAYVRQLTFVEGRPEALLIVEYYGSSEAELRAKIERLESHLQRRRLAGTFVRAMTAAEQANVWGVRRAGLGLLMSARGDHKPLAFMEDAAVPVEQLADYVRAVQAIFAEHGVRSAYYAHASAGCLHIRPLLNLKTAEGVAALRAIAGQVLDVVIAMGGAMSGEHGDGLSRSCWNERLYGPELYGAFRDLKRAFDPENRLNPGKIVDAPPVTEHLRYGPDYQTISLTTHIDFSHDGGFARAVEMCNGAAACRKEGQGVMCPSYRVTREEEHSTRGRANALRAALSGLLPPAALTERRMYQVMELCIECKGCKAECPSAVDMAKIKYEFLAHYHQRNGTPLRARLFANIGRISRIACGLSPIANWILARPLLRRLNERLFGIAHQRTLPPFAAQPFERWYAGYRKSYCARDTVRLLKAPSPGALNRERGSGGESRQVVLFHDTFNNYNHPEVAIAATRLLDAAGFEVLLAPKVCCGRPMISKGLLGQARANAAHNVAALAPYAERGVPVVGLEPSCLLTLRDEYLDLLPDDPRAKVVAENSWMLEEFLSGLAERGDLNLRWRPAEGAPRRLLVHGHCYQKALVSTQPLLAMLRLPGWQVSEIPSGCCGMAGSFGYEAEHYEFSLKIGEDRLFPAVRAAEADVTIVAAGVSCRHQIAHATGRTPKHPAELLAEAIV